MVELYPLHKEGFLSNLNWVYDHDQDVLRFLDKYWMPEDHPFWWDWFLDNPYYCRIIITDFLRDNDNKISEVIHEFGAGKSLIVFVLGKRGSGKTGTIFWLAELVKDTRQIYCIMLNGQRKQQYPDWIIQVDDISECGHGGLAFYDEGVLQANARESGGKQAVWLTKEMAIARHKDLTVIIGLQHTKLGDVNIFRMADCSFVKPNNAFLKTDERSFAHAELVKFMQPASPELTLFVKDNKYIKFIQPLPDCWCNEISKAHSYLDVKEFEINAKKEKSASLKDRDQGQKKQPASIGQRAGNHQSDKSLAYLT